MIGIPADVKAPPQEITLQPSTAHRERGIVTAMIVSDTALKRIIPDYQAKYFTASFSATMAGWCIEYQKQYGRAPGPDIHTMFDSHRRNGMGEDEARLISQFLISLKNDFDRENFNENLAVDEALKYFRERSLTLLKDDLEHYLEGGNVETGMQAVENFKAIAKQQVPPLAYAAITPTSDIIRTPPPPREFLFQNMLPKGIVGGLIAIGGTGKGYLMNLLSLSLATGTPIGPFLPSRAFKVLYLGGEDDQAEINRRTHWTALNIWPEGPPESVNNFIPISTAGVIGPLMQTDRGGNPSNAPAYDWICSTLENLGNIEVLILDPKSMFYGLEENNNDHNTAWVKCLQSIVGKFGVTSLFAHHESKARAGSMDSASSRGGQALTDGCRWVANIRTMDPKTADKFSLPEHQDFVEFVVTKSNYAPRLPNPIYFRRGRGGALSFVDLVAERSWAIALKLRDILAAETEPLSKNELLYQAKGKPIADKLKEEIQGFGRVKDLTNAIAVAVAGGLLEEEAQKGQGHRGKTILTVRRPTLRAVAPAGDGA